MAREKEKQIKLSYESDGEMGHENINSEDPVSQNNETVEKFFFNTTQNSE